ncbi:MAG: TlpA disulfide reductase family protein [Micrococcaceae bacterium]
MKKVATLALLGALVSPLAACSSQDSLSKQANSGDQKNYIAGDGTVAEYAPGNRIAAVDFTGKTFEGQEINASQLRGKPTILNFWYASCAPCRKEAPALEQVNKGLTGKVNFYGVNMRDTKENVDAFNRTFNISYPSFDDRNGKIMLAFNASVSPQAVPTTLVLDKQGRVAARVLGVTDKSTLNALVNKVLSE